MAPSQHSFTRGEAMPPKGLVDLAGAVRERAVEVTRFWLSGIYIEGMEVTQAIQWRGASQHLTDSKDWGPDNGVTLVADKPAMLRIYVHANFAPVTGVVATVTVQRRRWGIWVDAYDTPVPQ